MKSVPMILLSCTLFLVAAPAFAQSPIADSAAGSDDAEVPAQPTHVTRVSLPPGATSMAHDDAWSQEPRTYRRYGWMIMATDALTIGLGVATKRPEVAAAGYLMGAPFVHAFNRQGKQSLWSLGARVGLPITGMLVGGIISGVASCAEWTCGMAAAGLGGSIGVVTAMSLDWFVFSKKANGPSVRVAMMPNLSLTGDRVTAGVVGRF